MVNLCRKVIVKVEEGGPLPVQITAPWSSSQRISQQAATVVGAGKHRDGPWEKPWKNPWKNKEKIYLSGPQN